MATGKVENGEILVNVIRAIDHYNRNKKTIQAKLTQAKLAEYVFNDVEERTLSTKSKTQYLSHWNSGWMIQRVRLAHIVRIQEKTGISFNELITVKK